MSRQFWFVASVVALLLARVDAQAALSYSYDWSTLSNSTITLNSDGIGNPKVSQYQMLISNEALKGPLGTSTDTTASQLTIIPKPGVAHPQNDTFHGEVDLKLVIYDHSNLLDNHLDPLK